MSEFKVTINDKTTDQKGKYSFKGDTWYSIPTDPISVTNQIWIKLNDEGFFDICFNMNGSSTNVAFTAEFMATNIWKLSNNTDITTPPPTLNVTIKDPGIICT